MNYSTTYIAVLTTLIAPFAGNYVSDACAGEVSGALAGSIVAGLSAVYLLVKRYQKGDVTAFGVRKDDN
jgi:hypothetical protein